MNGSSFYGSPAKPLPPPASYEKLPPLPPPNLDGQFGRPPPPPVKSNHGSPRPARSTGPSVRDPGIPASLHDPVLSPPRTPGRAGQLLPDALGSSADGRDKKPNPLTDLLETEKVYVDLLAGVIRKVAGAWSRSNLPPPEMDIMFRGIESVYKANRSMLSKLKDVGANAPKELGDLVMRWIDHIEAPYAAYFAKFCSGFDSWEPVQSNPRVRTVLAIFSSTNPPPSAVEHPSEPPIWTLDTLFQLPKDRLKYYTKLYQRLLKTSTPGREEYRLLSSALAKIDRLLATWDQRAGIEVGAPRTVHQDIPEAEVEDEVVIDMRLRNSTAVSQPQPSAAPSPQRISDESHVGTNDLRSPVPVTPSIPDNRTPIAEVERRLATERTLDIFTMKPKQVRLQLSPPSLPFMRELRYSVDVVIRFTPQSTGEDIVQEHGHIFILTDLILICERMTPRERTRWGPDGPDMWLSYPPLAGKHLRVTPASASNTTLTLTILKKENLTLFVGSPGLRERLLSEFRECIEAASDAQRRSGPPLPAPPLPASSTVQTPSSHSQAQISGHATGPAAPDRSVAPMGLPSRVLSPSNAAVHEANGPQPINAARFSSGDDAPLADSMARMDLASATQPSRPPSGQNQPAYPVRSSSRSTKEARPAPAPQLTRGPSVGPGQIVPHQMSRPNMGMPPQGYGPGQVVPQQGYGPGQVVTPPSYPSQGGPPWANTPAELPRQEQAPMSSFAPGQMVPSGREGPPRATPQLTLDPGLNVPSRFEGGLRSAPPDAGFGGLPSGPSRPVPNRSLSGHSPTYHPGAAGPGHPAYPSPSSARPASNSSSQNSSNQGGLRKSTSSRSLRSQQDTLSTASAPPMPGYPNDLVPPTRHFLPRKGSSSSLHSLPSQLQAVYSKPLLPSAQMSLHSVSTATSFHDPSPPESPVEERPPPIGPTTTNVTAQMKCKVFLQQQHAQWKSLGASKLRLYHESPTNVKQLVAEADNKDKTILISTIVMEDGVERVGKTGVAVELSDKGRRTGIIYMIQLRNEKAAGGLFDSLIAGSDRSGMGRN